jgi:hypothetical protein
MDNRPELDLLVSILSSYWENIDGYQLIIQTPHGVVELWLRKRPNAPTPDR